jgi:hypothetical protein
MRRAALSPSRRGRVDRCDLRRRGAGRGDGSKKGDYFDVLTDLGEVTANATTPFPTEQFIHSAFLYTGDPAKGTGEYWLLVSSSQPGTDSDSIDENKIWRVRLTFPADLSKGTPGSIKAEVLGPPQELKGTPLSTSDGGIYGLAVGREVAPGKRIIYMGDWGGNIITLRPAQ